MCLDELEYVLGIETGAARNEMRRSCGSDRERPQPTAVRERTSMQHYIVRAQPVDLARVLIRHELQVGMSHHRALGLARGAGGIEQPGDVGAIADGVGVRRVTGNEEIFVGHRPLRYAPDADRD